MLFPVIKETVESIETTEPFFHYFNSIFQSMEEYLRCPQFRHPITLNQDFLTFIRHNGSQEDAFEVMNKIFPSVICTIFVYSILYVNRGNFRCNRKFMIEMVTRFMVWIF